MIRLLGSVVVCAVLAACSHEKPKDEKAAAATTPQVVSENIAPDAGSSMETKQVAAESNAPFSTEIRFTKKSSTLTHESTSRIAKVLKDARAVGEIGEIDAYIWSDQEYPGKKAKKLPAKAHDLAASRGANIKAYVGGVDASLGDHVKIITMTEQPEGLKASLSLGDTRDKKMFDEAGINTTDKNKKAAPKASKAAIIVILKK